MCSSPFRDDGKRESFSVFEDGKAWKDHGGGGAKGDVWLFVKRCWPNEDDKTTARRMIEISGITPTPRPPAGAPVAVAVGAVDPRLAAAAKALAKKDLVKEQEERVYDARERDLRPRVARPAVVWPPCVAERFNEGVTFLRGEPKRIEKLAVERGWPVEWAAELVERELVSYAWEPRAVPGQKFASRQKAFVVQTPRVVDEGGWQLEAVGFHQRWFAPARNGEEAQKGWRYVPARPDEKTREWWTPFQHALAEVAEARMGDKAGALVPALPFVLGDLRRPKLIVLLEGQWDAITFFGACGYFHDTTPAEGVAVFGIRGAQGADVFLAHWRAWLLEAKPRVWVIADNDAAGGAWREAPAAEAGLPRPPSLAEKLAAAECRSVVVSWLKPGAWGKDFNDYYRARRVAGADVGPDKMRAWMHRVGRGGEWVCQ